MKGGFEADIDALFQLPLADFTGARNTLAARLKKEGRRNDAERVKLLAKPSVSAWTVNQLYWQHPEALDQLVATGKRLRPVQTARSAGKGARMRESLDARRDAVNELSDLAADLLRDAGHSPTQDMMRRIITTVEALSAYALLPDGPTPGRLTQDVDPPSFESLASFMSGAGSITHTEEPSRKSVSAGPSPRQKATTTGEVRRIEDFRRTKIAAAKATLQDAKKSLADARTRVQTLESIEKRTNADAKDGEKQRREAEERLKKATAAAQEMARRAQIVGADVEEATQALEDAKRAFEAATKDLESLLQQ